MQAMCQVYAAVSYICLGDAESSGQVNNLYSSYHICTFGDASISVDFRSYFLENSSECRLLI